MSLPFFSLFSNNTLMDFYDSTQIGSFSNWITTAEAKAHLRVDFDDDDTYIAELATCALEACEKILGYRHGQYNHVGYSGTFDRVVHFRQHGLSGTPTVQYYEDGRLETVDATNYRATRRSYPGKIVFDDSFNLTNPKHDPEFLQVSWTSNVTTVDPMVKRAGLMIIGHLYEMRQDVGYSRVFEVPMSSTYLLQKCRKQSFA